MLRSHGLFDFLTYRSHNTSFEGSENLLVSLILGILRAIIPIVGLVGCPQSKVISQELHDKSGVLVRFLVQCVELGNGIIESLLRNLASLVRRIENLVVEDREVEGQSQSDRMRWWKIRGGNSTGSLVGIEGGSARLLADITSLELREITVVVSLHFVVEDLGLLGSGVGDQRLLDDSENVIADLNKFSLNLGLVVLDDGHLVGVSLLFDGSHDSPRSTAGPDHVLVGDREQVALLDGQLLWLTGNILHVGDHFIESLGLFSQFSYEGDKETTAQSVNGSMVELR
jgi:hypothetical protein